MAREKPTPFDVDAVDFAAEAASLRQRRAEQTTNASAEAMARARQFCGSLLGVLSKAAAAGVPVSLRIDPPLRLHGYPFGVMVCPEIADRGDSAPLMSRYILSFEAMGLNMKDVTDDGGEEYGTSYRDIDELASQVRDAVVRYLALGGRTVAGERRSFLDLG